MSSCMAACEDKKKMIEGRDFPKQLNTKTSSLAFLSHMSESSIH